MENHLRVTIACSKKQLLMLMQFSYVYVTQCSSEIPSSEMIEALCVRWSSEN